MMRKEQSNKMHLSLLNPGMSLGGVLNGNFNHLGLGQSGFPLDRLASSTSSHGQQQHQDIFGDRRMMNRVDRDRLGSFGGALGNQFMDSLKISSPKPQGYSAFGNNMVNDFKNSSPWASNNINMNSVQQNFALGSQQSNNNNGFFGASSQTSSTNGHLFRSPDKLEVCRDFLRKNCHRSDKECKFAHPVDKGMIHTHDNTVTVCMDSIKDRCTRERCKFFHPPPKLKMQVKANHQQHRNFHQQRQNGFPNQQFGNFSAQTMNGILGNSNSILVSSKNDYCGQITKIFFSRI